jgi:hypothetical protein
MSHERRIKKLEVGIEDSGADLAEKLARHRRGEPPPPLRTKEECERMAKLPGLAGAIGRAKLRVRAYKEGVDELEQQAKLPGLAGENGRVALKLYKEILATWGYQQPAAPAEPEVPLA